MATTGVINGTIIAITIGGTKITNQLSASLSVTHDVRTWINKDSAGWEASGAGKKGWEMSGEANLALDAAYGMDDLYDAMIAGTEVSIDWTTGVSGDYHFSGTAQVTKLESAPGVEETTNYSYGFKGNGALTKATVS